MPTIKKPSDEERDGLNESKHQASNERAASTSTPPNTPLDHESVTRQQYPIGRQHSHAGDALSPPAFDSLVRQFYQRIRQYQHQQHPSATRTTASIVQEPMLRLQPRTSSILPPQQWTISARQAFLQRQRQQQLEHRPAAEGRSRANANESRRSSSVTSTGADLSENAKCIRILLDLPGVRPGDVTVSTDQPAGVVTVVGVRRIASLLDDEAAAVVCVKRQRTMTRRYAVNPKVVDLSKLRASLQFGVLEITAPKFDEGRTRRAGGGEDKVEDARRAVVPPEREGAAVVKPRVHVIPTSSHAKDDEKKNEESPRRAQREGARISIPQVILPSPENKRKLAVAD